LISWNAKSVSDQVLRNPLNSNVTDIKYSNSHANFDYPLLFIHSYHLKPNSKYITEKIPICIQKDEKNVNILIREVFPKVDKRNTNVKIFRMSGNHGDSEGAERG